MADISHQEREMLVSNQFQLCLWACKAF